MSFEFELTFREEGEEYLAVPGECVRIGYLWLLVTIFVREEGLFIVFVLESVVLIFQRLMVSVQALEYLLVFIVAVF